MQRIELALYSKITWQQPMYWLPKQTEINQNFTQSRYNAVKYNTVMQMTMKLINNTSPKT